MAPSEAVTAERQFAERSSDSECRRPPAEVEGEILRVLVGTQHLSLAVTLTYGRLFVDSSLFPPAQKTEPNSTISPGTVGVATQQTQSLSLLLGESIHSFLSK
jgi:hypothetical protein